MTKKYGSYGGGAPEPSSSAAIGGWNNAEVYRQVELTKWPQFVAGVTAPLSSIVYAISSGVVFASIEDNSYLVPSGQEISRTGFSELFDTFGTTFGSGDGTTTFNLPNYQNPFERCFKYVTNSGLVPDQLVGSGVIPFHTHSHTCGRIGGSPFAPDAPSGSNGINGNSGFTFTAIASGSDAGNTPTRKYFTPLISASGDQVKLGMVIPMILSNVDDIIEQLPDNVIIPSGQEVLRNDYFDLFSLIGVEYGSGNSTTTFNLPDLRGIFPALPYPNVALASGAGTHDSRMASHFHQVANARQQFPASKPNNGSVGALNTFNDTTGASSTTFTGNEDRPNNYCAIFCLVAQEASI